MMHASDYANMDLEQMQRKLVDNKTKDEAHSESLQ